MNNLTKKYGKKLVLNNAEFSFEKNAVNLVIGKNGSGKTTLFKTLYGLIRRYEGEKDPCSYRMMSEDPVFFKSRTGMDNLEFFLDKEEFRNVDEYVEAFSMQDYIYQKVKTYSQGMRKKLALTMILSSTCDVMLMDEPTNGLDVPSVMILRSIIKKKKEFVTIVISSHDSGLFDSRFADAVFLLKDNTVVKMITEEQDSSLFVIGTLTPIDEKLFTVVDRYSDGSYCIRINKGKEAETAEALSAFGLVLFKPSDVAGIKAGLLS